MDTEDTKYCSNCKRDIAAHSFQIHEVHCHRHIVLCSTCGEPVPRTQLEEHFEENHTEAPCDLCGHRMAKDQLEEHKEEYCPERMIRCKHCELEVKAIDFQEHIAACGSRTDVCDKCFQRVMLRDMESHQKHGCIKPHPPGTNPFRSQLPFVGGNRPRPQPLPINGFTSTNQPTAVSMGGATATNRSTTAVSMGGAANISIGGLHFSQKQDQTNRVKPYVKDLNIPSMSRPIGSHNIGRNSGRHPMVNIDGSVVNTSAVQVAEPRQEGGHVQSLTEQPAHQIVVSGSFKSNEPQHVKENKEYQLLDDEEMARKLQQKYNQEETTLAYHTSLAHQFITDDESPYYKKARPNDPYNDIHTPDIAPPINTQLEENERRPDDPFSSDDEDILTKQLRQEERHGTHGLPTMLLFKREMEKSHEDEERQQQVERDNDIARQLQEEEENNTNRFLSGRELPSTPPPYPHLRMPNEPIVPELSEQDLLTEQLELEEYHGSQGLSTMVLYNKEMTKAEEDEEKRQRLERDLEIAKQLQEEEDRETKRQLNAIFNPPQEANVSRTPPPSPTPSPTHSPPPYRHVQTHQELREEPEDETLHVEDNYIPCELCGERILFEMFSFHLDERHPQFSDVFYAHRQAHLGHTSIPQERRRPNPTIPATTTTAVTNNIYIPCQYCGFKYAPSTMPYHETICDQNPDKNLKSVYPLMPPAQPDKPVTPPIETDLLPCQFCNKQFPLLAFGDHQKNCPDRFLPHNIDIGRDYGIYGSNLPTSSDKDLVGGATTDVVDEIPCEKCHKSFPMKEFHKHEATCHYQKPKQSSFLPQHNPSSHIPTSSGTTGGIFSTSASYRLSPSPDPPVSKATFPRQRIKLAAQFPESKTKSDTLLGTTNQLLTTKPKPKPRTLTNISKGGAVKQERLGSDIQRDGKQPLLPSKACTGNKLSDSPKTRSSLYSSDTKTTATKVKSSTNTNRTQNISHVTRSSASRGKPRDHVKEEEQYGLFIERADEEEEEDMEIDQECPIDTMESTITTGLTTTRLQAHSLSSTTPSGRYPKNTRELVTSRDDLLPGDLSYLSISGTKIGSPSNGRLLRSNSGSHTTSLGYQPQKTRRTSHNGLSNNPPGRRPHRGGGASGMSGNYSLPSSYQYNN